ncbi:HD domain-containing protein [Paracoccus marinaquae]|uniref:HD family hydrolase n=1 Tax=Paracoccus marinaquae TaxID=2841926 RepID=A0ABS6AEL7_9RHOB|nr:HD family hydrolase [Paracoccus marinaquae]MBU3029038.1 HD family hydrolase [Paracoccus marinaquae]
MPPRPQRAWQRMLSGRRLDLLDPTPFDIEIEDIAHGLAFVARWNGQTHGDWPYSVAEHSLLVEDIFARLNPTVEQRWRLAALLHDAPEYVIGDMISPVKAALGREYGAMDERLTAAIHRRFGLPAALPIQIKRKIKQADRISARLEAVQIAGFTETEARRLFPVQNEHILSAVGITLCPPAEVRERYLDRFQALIRLIDKKNY